jgi:hypothetical protein
LLSTDLPEHEAEFAVITVDLVRLELVLAVVCEPSEYHSS